MSLSPLGMMPKRGDASRRDETAPVISAARQREPSLATTSEQCTMPLNNSCAIYEEYRRRADAVSAFIISARVNTTAVVPFYHTTRAGRRFTCLFRRHARARHWPRASLRYWRDYLRIAPPGFTGLDFSHARLTSAKHTYTIISWHQLYRRIKIYKRPPIVEISDIVYPPRRQITPLSRRAAAGLIRVFAAETQVSSPHAHWPLDARHVTISRAPFSGHEFLPPPRAVHCHYFPVRADATPVQRARTAEIFMLKPLVSQRIWAASVIELPMRALQVSFPPIYASSAIAT